MFGEQYNLQSKVQELILYWSNKHIAEVKENDALVEQLQNKIKELKERENQKRKAEEDPIEEEPS